MFIVGCSEDIMDNVTGPTAIEDESDKESLPNTLLPGFDFDSVTANLDSLNPSQIEVYLNTLPDLTWQVRLTKWDGTKKAHFEMPNGGKHRLRLTLKQTASTKGDPYKIYNLLGGRMGKILTVTFDFRRYIPSSKRKFIKGHIRDVNY